MDLIFFDKNYQEIGPANIYADFEIGDRDARNDFEVLSGKVYGYGIYSPDTEIGGVFEYTSTVYGEMPSTRGWTWRGLLTQGIIDPPVGSDYRVVSGEANNVLRNLLSGFLGGFFVIPQKNSGLTISSYQFKLHCTYLDGITEMLAEKGYKLKIYAKKSDIEKKVLVYAEAVRITVLDGEYNEDSDVKLELIDNRMGCNHLICLGKGELQNRKRIDLYLQKDGSVGLTRAYTGFMERTAVFDYSSAESDRELRLYGTRRLKEIGQGKQLKIISEKKELEIGDVVRGRYREDNVTVQAPVVRKIYRINGTEADIEYSIKED